MKRSIYFLATLILSIVSIMSLAIQAKADVYGYISTISATNDGATVVNNGSVLKEDTQKGLLNIALKVIDPANPDNSFAVTKWMLTVLSRNETGQVIAEASFEIDRNGVITASTDTEQYWNISDILVDNNILIFKPTLTTGLAAVVEMTAQAWVDTKKTNTASTQIFLTADKAAASTPAVATPIKESWFRKLKGLTSKYPLYSGAVIVIALSPFAFLLARRRKKDDPKD